MEVLLADCHMNEPQFSDLMSGILNKMLDDVWVKGADYGEGVKAL